MDELHKITVGFSDGTILEVSDIENTYENLVAGFIRVEAEGGTWVFFFDKMKYLVHTPQSSKGSTNNE